MKVLYFTATGNCLYVAKHFGGEHYSIPRLLKEGQLTIEDDKIGLVYPIYNLSVPKYVEEFLDKVKLKSNYIFAVGTYGMFAGGASRHLLEIGKRNGINFSYINELVMVDNYLPGFEMKMQINSQGKKRIEENLDQIVKDVENKRLYIKKHTSIMKPLRQLGLLMESKSFEKGFYTEDKCDSCKTCEKVCPVNNIQVAKKPVFSQNCQRCLACIQNCPKKAIHHEKEKSGERFRNEHISLKEIIHANQ
jgi:ferredoxin